MTQLIDTLHDLIAPKLADTTTAAKTPALTALFGLLIARLGDTAVVKRIETQLDTGADSDAGTAIFGALTGGQDSVVQALAAQAGTDKAALSTLAASALPLAYGQIKTLAQGAPLADFVKPEQQALADKLPWLAGVLVLMSPAAAASSLSAAGATSAPATPAPAPASSTTSANGSVATPMSASTPVADENKGSFLKSLLPLVGALIVGLLAWVLLRACQQQPTPITEPPAPSATEVAKATATPATFSMALDDTGSKPMSCSGKVGSDVLGGQLHSIIAEALGKADCAFEVADNTAGTLTATQYLPQIFGFMKGVPAASIAINDKHIVVNAATAEAKQKLLQDIQVALPDFTVEAEPELDAAAATISAIDASKSAITGLGADASINDLVRALNLQIINFAVGSSDVPPANQEILDKAAAFMADKADAHLVISGHTDSTGNADANKTLSQARAEAVKAYLVSKGVSADKLSAQGMGSDKPVADNASEQGRFKNRRIEFAVGEAAASTEPAASAQ